MAKRILQINLNPCRVAQALAMQKACEMQADAVAICEQNANEKRGGWYSDLNGKAAIVVPPASEFMVDEVGPERTGYVWVRSGSRRLYSCYISPNADWTEFRDFLESLEGSLEDWRGRNTIVCGDFNAKSPDWGATREDRRGAALSEIVSRLDWAVTNRGDYPTFQRGVSESILDLTFVSAAMATKINGWSVLEDETLGDHLYVAFWVDGPTFAVTRKRREGGWAIKMWNKEAFSDIIRGASVVPDSGTIETSMGRMMETVTAALDLTAP
ncbi:uncharacterized protein LOC105702562 [Orussus abietinus]|uniref:uncharacterized protein LOC105702562 n=1 Tax=Orussus abietinus TaxID=222816 RepID=UPI00062631EC|nr:uncharacterized protein LOC105702562 [Orussus abietinus]